jgi:predicted metalloendopeptidase
MDQPELGMPSKEYYHKAEYVAVYEKFAADTAVIFGADEARAKKEMKEAVQLEIKLADVS